MKYSWNEQCEVELKLLLYSLKPPLKHAERPKGRGVIRNRTNVPTSITTPISMLQGWDGRQNYFRNKFRNGESQN